MQANQFENILYAAVIGDALGVPVEFSQRDTYYLDMMVGFGSWNQPLGSWSDDTSLTLPLIENLTNNGTYEQLMQKFVDYMFHRQYTPDNIVFGMGNTCIKAIRNYTDLHKPALMCGDDSLLSNGNGALMRLAPLAIHLRNETDLETRLELTRNYTCLTHRHSRSIVASYIYLEILHSLLNDKSLLKTLKVLPEQLQMALKDKPEELKQLALFKDIFQPKFSLTPRSDIKSTGYVIDTLQACIWCVLKSTSIDSATILAVNLGDDTDTIASITATIASCLYQDELVNEQWKSQLRNQALLNEIIEPFVEKETLR